MKKTTMLKSLLNGNKTVIAPGAFDGMSAKLIERAGFSTAYITGGGLARSAGYPDLGLLDFSEVCDRLEKIVDVTNIPVIADADTGFGNEVNVYRTIRTFERIGIAGCHIEDQAFPKRCGHLDNKSLISVEEMLKKIKVAKTALHDKDFTLIIRTDAIEVEGFDSAIERAEAYAEAGADMLFIEAPRSLTQIKKIGEKIKTPKLINMFNGGKTPVIPVSKLAELGFKLVIIPSDLQRASIKAMEDTLQAIYRDGDSSAISEKLATFDEREEIIETSRYLSL
ncbi:oxaloacetate decarboxylase [Lentisphaerota bacterium ZTH]|nr:oxaloacetate decarboxylase [Lentisphaerota bacterium]WET05908.1 oxaloacetate decarboxylase [Lentisphaerota bacterium ZTH]